ncbi:hypothetical protein LGV61_06435 [Desulfurispirillum indicum]|uniref:hypothetical protein n=1 Tax=Desulfurispirillum indicum TaxID=936456 RepID=UPI001CFA193E|nr:hypothetical protein [Desulfurispirillum indicum]UCZ57905.1 hypothetical protein LGV61_06435 [Desulfurispirillum indicum]
MQNHGEGGNGQKNLGFHCALTLWQCDADGTFRDAVDGVFPRIISPVSFHQNWLTDSHPDDHEQLKRQWQEAFAHHRPFRATHHLNAQERVWWRVHTVGEPCFRQDGTFQGYQGYTVFLEPVEFACGSSLYRGLPISTRTMASGMGAVASRIRKPMNMLALALLSIDSEQDVSPAGRRWQEKAQVSVNEIMQILAQTEQLQDFQHVATAFDMRMLMREVFELAADQLRSRRISLSWSCQPLAEADCHHSSHGQGWEHCPPDGMLVFEQRQQVFMIHLSILLKLLEQVSPQKNTCMRTALYQHGGDLVLEMRLSPICGEKDATRLSDNGTLNLWQEYLHATKNVLFSWRVCDDFLELSWRYPLFRFRGA